jgi:Protein of unknown function (DUF1642).|nr:MAG TPA: Protein of unknown function (DUF1642) [Caudoviricetes sp.]
MNVKELIEKIEALPAENYKYRPHIDKKLVLGLVRQLDEPQPLKLKDIISRMKQLFPLSRAEWIDEILKEFGEDFGSIKYRSGYEQGKLEGAWVGNQLKDADKIRQELNKPVIPQFVAVWIEECKAKGKNLLRALLYTPEKVNSWVDDPDNQEIFALAWMFGYTVENEKRYMVKMKGLSECYNYLNYDSLDDEWYFTDAENGSAVGTHHTRKKFEDAGFGEVFNSPLFEVEEVE